MSNHYEIRIQAKTDKPTFIIHNTKTNRNVGRFTATLHTRGGKAAGSAFAAIVMRLVTGFPVNVVGKMLRVDVDSIVGENLITEQLIEKSKHYYDGLGVPMTVEAMYHGGIERQFSLGFFDTDGNRVSTMPCLTRSKYQVSYSKQAD